MAVINQLAGVYCLDLPVHNYGGSQLNAGVAVILDQSNPPTSNTGVGVTLPASDAKSFGVLVENIPAGKAGRVRVLGVAVAIPTVGQSFNVGDPLMTDASGFVKPCGAGNYQLGVALSQVSTAVSGDTCLIFLDRAKNA